MQARDFFHQIDLAFHIQPPARQVDSEVRIAAPLGHQVKAELLETTKYSVFSSSSAST